MIQQNHRSERGRQLINSPVGKISLLSEGDAIVGLYFGDVKNEWDIGQNRQNHRVLTQCEEELKKYFAGELKEFTVAVRAVGTAFRERVWAELSEIPYGRRLSYKDIALRIGNEKAVRAVGGANHHNPVSIIIPCHRVVGADGSLTGYGGGMEAKRWLLDLEAKHAGKTN